MIQINNHKNNLKINNTFYKLKKKQAFQTAVPNKQNCIKVVNNKGSR